MTDPLIQAPNLDDIRTASELIAPHIVRTPILRLNSRKRENEIYLKLENLQPIGVFKVRSMGNILLSTDSDSLKNGVYTASSGNAGIGLAWMAEKLGLEARVYAPESGPQGKLSTMREFGAHVEIMGDDDWWQIIQNSGHPDDAGFYVDAMEEWVSNKKSLPGKRAKAENRSKKEIPLFLALRARLHSVPPTQKDAQ